MCVCWFVCSKIDQFDCLFVSSLSVCKYVSICDLLEGAKRARSQQWMSRKIDLVYTTIRLVYTTKERVRNMHRRDNQRQPTAIPSWPLNLGHGKWGSLHFQSQIAEKQSNQLEEREKRKTKWQPRNWDLTTKFVWFQYVVCLFALVAMICVLCTVIASFRNLCTPKRAPQFVKLVNSWSLWNSIWLAPLSIFISSSQTLVQT